VFGQGKPRMEREPALDAKKQMAIFLSNESGSIDVIVTQLYYTQTQMLSLTHSLTRSLTHSLTHSLTRRCCLKVSVRAFAFGCSKAV